MKQVATLRLKFNRLNYLDYCRDLWLPAFIIISIIFLIAYGFWNIYNQEYQSQYNKPSIYQSIQALTEPDRSILNQSITLGGVGIIEKFNDNSFLVSDGAKILLVIIPDGIDVGIADQKITNLPKSIILRGKIRAFDENIIQKYHLTAANNLVLQKQKIYLETTETPKLNLDMLDDDLSDLTETV